MIRDIKCLNPRFVVNPSLLHLLTIHRKYCVNGVVHNASNHQITLWKFDGLGFFHSYLSSLDFDNVNNFGVVDKDTGELLPMFICVPCGKCVCCRAKKALDWKVRCMCESSTSNCPPLFFTLTYDNDHLPSDGVNKEHIQLFMKRLRARLEYYNFDCSELRYFIVAEYGSHTLRPHYHGIFWNFPYFDRFIDKIDIIHECWQNGFTMVSPARDLSGAYCMKYMQKEKVVLDGMNEQFFLSSRGHGGIGSRWLKDNFAYYRQFPRETKIRVKSLDGTIHELPMPTYFQRKLYPSVCGLIPIKVRKALDLWLNYRYLASICNDYCKKVYLRIKHNRYDDDKIFAFFKHFGLIDDEYDLSQTYNYFSFIHEDLRNNIDNKDFLKLSFKYYHELECSNANLLLNFIGDLDSHIQEIDEIKDIGVIHKDFVNRCLDNLEDVALQDFVYNLNNINAKSLQKEIF